MIYEIKNLTKTYENGKIVANSDLNFKIKPSEIFGLLGPNGSGKTTLIKQMVGLLKPDKGEIYFKSKDVVNNPEIVNRRIGYMSQRVGALADLTVEEALYITSNLYGFRRDVSKIKTKEMIKNFKMFEFKDRIMGKLSGGQARLVAFALSIIHNPDVVFLDEPTNDIDPEVRAIIWEKIIDLKENYDTAIIIATHNLSEAEKVLDRVAIMEKGKIVEIGNIDMLKEKVLRNKYIISLEYQEDILHTIDISESDISENVLSIDGNKLLISSKDFDSALEILNDDKLREIGEIKDFTIRHGNLDELYLNIINNEKGETN